MMKPLIIVSGENNSGKTTLIKSLLYDIPFMEWTPSTTIFAHRRKNISPGLCCLHGIAHLCRNLPDSGSGLRLFNPETHLSPRLQFCLGHLLARTVSRGGRMIVETLSGFLLSSLRYEVFKERLSPDDIIILHKSSRKAPFVQVYINKRGHYANEDGSSRPFPKGFHDVGLRQLFEIG